MSQRWKPTKWEWCRIWLASKILGDPLWRRAWRWMCEAEKKQNGK